MKPDSQMIDNKLLTKLSWEVFERNSYCWNPLSTNEETMVILFMWAQPWIGDSRDTIKVEKTVVQF